MTHTEATLGTNRPILLWMLLALACIARLVHLDADPKFATWLYYIQDEGRWIETARNLALFGEIGLYELSRLHLTLSLGFQAAVFAIFKIAGVNLWSARLWTALCGAAMLCAVFLFLRRRVNGLPLALGLVILAFEPLTLSMSRVAIPEVPALLFTWLAFVALCTRRRRVLGAFVSGLCLATAISMKGTTVLVVPVFLLMAAVSSAEHGAPNRLRRCGAYLCGLALPALAVLALALASGQLEPRLNPVLVRVLGGFFGLASPYVVVARVLGLHDTGNLNLLVLGSWLCSWMFIFRKELRGHPCAETHALTAIWGAGWLAVWTLMYYLPERYYVHVTLPLTVNLAAGLGLWRHVGFDRACTGIAALCMKRGVGVVLWLVLPAAAVVAAWSAPLASLAGFTFDRARDHVFLLALVAGGMAVGVWLRGISGAGVAAFIVFPVAAVLAGLLAEEAAVAWFDWPLVQAGLPVVKLGIALTVAWRVIAAPVALGSAGARVILPNSALAVVFASLLLASRAELFLPTYSMREASTDLQRRMQDAGFVQSSGAGMLFVGTRLRYRDAPLQNQAADAVVNFDRNIGRGPMFLPETTYRIDIHPGYHEHGKVRARTESGHALVEVYRLRTLPDRASLPAAR